MNLNKHSRRFLKGRAAQSVIVALTIFAVLAVYLFWPEEETAFFTGDGVWVHFIDVGQGDCALIQSPGGNILIDAGTPDSEHTIVRYMDELGIERFSCAIFTHPHADHIGCAAALLERYSFAAVILPDAVSTSRTFERMMEALENEGCDVIAGHAGLSYTLGDLELDLLAPVLDYGDDLNNQSTVCKFTYGEISFLFTGDAETESERDMLREAPESLCASVLKVGHHGSNTSSSDAFIEAAAPQVAVISVGEDNEYGHPSALVISRLKAAGASVYRTDQAGNVVVYTNGKEIQIQTQN